MPIFPVGQKLLAAQLNDMNIERIVANSGFQTSEVGSFGSVIANSGFQTSEVGSFGSVNVSSGFQTSEVGSFGSVDASSGFQTVGVGSFGSVDVSSWVKGPGLIVTGQSSLGSILVNSGVLLAAAPSPPVANEVYQESIIKGWVRFDGTAVASFGDVGSSSTGIAGSFNVAGIHDIGTGRYTIYWDTNFANANYSAVGSTIDSSNGSSESIDTMTAGSCRYVTRRTDTEALEDFPVNNVIATGDQ